MQFFLAVTAGEKTHLNWFDIEQFSPIEIEAFMYRFKKMMEEEKQRENPGAMNLHQIGSQFTLQKEMGEKKEHKKSLAEKVRERRTRLAQGNK